MIFAIVILVLAVGWVFAWVLTTDAPYNQQWAVDARREYRRQRRQKR